jgi:peptidoglycan/LPS O-acetylase OafA/YrhL
VFFVISGFLITSHLYARPPRTAQDLAGFWARRVRRLLPASLLVLAVTVLASRLVAPETQWGRTATEAIAAALYVENWQLAGSSVDYLAAQDAPSPVQHFWSLSVEEQFYFVWPVLLLVLVACSLRTRWRQGAVVAVGLAVVVLASFVYSVVATRAEPASAYFVTPTRIWELGVGALLAVAVAHAPRGWHWLPWSRTTLAWLGLAAIAVSAVCYTGATPFPGWQAAVPVLGTAAVIGANAPLTGHSPGRVLALAPVQFLGGISYSVYLWHWPLVVLTPYVSGEPGWLDQVAILVLTIALGWLTKTFVEDRFRVALTVVPLRRTFALAAATMVVVVGLGFTQVVEVGLRDRDAAAQLASAIDNGGECFGAAALHPPADRCPPSTRGPVSPSPAQAADDKTDAYARDCFEPAPFTGVRRCVWGNPDADVSVALVGNSHAGHWLPALQTVAERRGWKVTTFLASECSINAAPVVWDTRAKQTGCLDWAEKVRAETSEGFDLVVTSVRNGRAAVGVPFQQSYPRWLGGYRDVVSGWEDRKTNVLVIHDTATPGATVKSIPDCIAQHEDDLTACAGPRSAWVPADPLVQAAEEADTARIATVDLNDYLCAGDVCAAVIGGVTVYSDASHLTRTYATTLAPYLEPELTAGVARAGRG